MRAFSLSLCVCVPNLYVYVLNTQIQIDITMQRVYLDQLTTNKEVCQLIFLSNYVCHLIFGLWAVCTRMHVLGYVQALSTSRQVTVERFCEHADDSIHLPTYQIFMKFRILYHTEYVLSNLFCLLHLSHTHTRTSKIIIIMIHKWRTHRVKERKAVYA